MKLNCTGIIIRDVQCRENKGIDLLAGYTPLSHDTRKPTLWFPTRSDTNRAVQAQMVRDWKF